MKRRINKKNLIFHYKHLSNETSNDFRINKRDDFFISFLKFD